MVNSSDESLQKETIYGCDRCFFSSPLLSVFLQHRCSTTGESNSHSHCFHISFPLVLLIHIFNYTGKHASFCYSMDENGSSRLSCQL